MPLCVESLVRLRHMIVIFLVSRHIYDLIRNYRIRRIIVIDLTVRRLDKAILINPCVSRKGVDQTDVRTFRSLNRAHSSIMGIMYVPDFESCAVS